MRKSVLLVLFLVLIGCATTVANSVPTAISQATSDARNTPTVQPLGTENSVPNATTVWGPYPAYTCNFKHILNMTGDERFNARWEDNVFRYTPPKGVYQTCTVVSYELPPNGKFEVTKNSCQHHHDAERTGKGDLLPLTTETTFETGTEMKWGVFVCPEDSDGFEITQIVESKE